MYMSGFLLGFLGRGTNVGLELKSGGMLAAFARPLEGGLGVLPHKILKLQMLRNHISCHLN